MAALAAGPSPVTHPHPDRACVVAYVQAHHPHGHHWWAWRGVIRQAVAACRVARPVPAVVTYTASASAVIDSFGDIAIPARVVGDVGDPASVRIVSVVADDPAAGTVAEVRGVDVLTGGLIVHLFVPDPGTVTVAATFRPAVTS
jgi:hypothetical protein